MPTLEASRTRIINDLGIGITSPSIDSIAVGSVTIGQYLRNLNWGGSQFQGNGGWGMHRPNAVTAADYFRFAGILTPGTGLLAKADTVNYTDVTATSETFNLLAPGIRADQDIDPAINRALEFLTFHNTEPLSLAPDAVMRETAFASWGTLVNATAAKVVTPAKVFPGMGISSAEVTCTSANGYQPTVAFDVTPSEPILIAALCRVNSGTSATLVPWDRTNSAVFGTGVVPVHSEHTWQYMVYSGTVPAGCRSMEIRLQGVGAADVIDWQALWFIRSSQTRFNLPASYLDERFKVDSVAAVGFGMATPGVTGSVYQALSIDSVEIPPANYDTDFPMPNANPSFIQFHMPTWRSWWSNRSHVYGNGVGGGGSRWFPLVVQMKLPYFERGALVLETDVTTCPLHLIVPAAEWQLLNSCAAARQASSKTLVQVKQEMDAAIRSRTTTGPARRHTNGVLIGSRN